MAYSHTVVKKRRKRKVRKKEYSTIYIGFIGFILISVYLFGYVYKATDKEVIAVEVVQNGTLEESKDYDGVIIRDEYVVRSLIEGEVTYYYSEGDRIKKDAKVCNVKDTKQTDVLEKKIAENDNEIMKIQENRSEISLYQNDINNRNKNIETITSNYITGTLETRLNHLYSFKNQLDSEIMLRNQMLLGENKGSLKPYVEEKFVNEEKLNNSISLLSSPVSGIISFSLDGGEDIYSMQNMEILIPEQTSMQIEPAEMINSSVKVNDVVFKVINSDEWYIATYIPNEVSKDWQLEDSKTLTFTNINPPSLDVKIKNIIQSNDQNLVIFYTDRNVADYLNIRSVNFKVDVETYEGLKVPKTSIVEKTFLKVPMEYIRESSEQYFITKSQESGDKEIQIKIAFKDETKSYAFILQDFNNIKLGDVLLKSSDSGQEEYILTGEQIEVSLAVYVVNRGMAELNTIEVIASNDKYAIIKGIGDYSVTIYDRIVSDAKNIVEGQVIY